MDELAVTVLYPPSLTGPDDISLVFDDSVTLVPGKPYRLRFEETEDVRRLPSEVAWLLYVPLLICAKDGTMTLEYYQEPGQPTLRERLAQTFQGAT